ncbi:6-pyruvoyl tetrahydrobiopterin synthase [Besnoitia besnoiti]|uniref:6-pyruvoyltetrahydropterin synthase n=1 Tax=Besnoitia besnoiti TaxID=94643 RepID=A0A2A9M851_BESBE|nr:6-pyruvoyl tetrahydrobiopterin synthase [Besnoitia besnoiti]PFH32471.1 6-pyruvoyl tetrahydrobiopterin synthase [Besnoitia besnoiti]
MPQRVAKINSSPSSPRRSSPDRRAPVARDAGVSLLDSHGATSLRGEAPPGGSAPPLGGPPPSSSNSNSAPREGAVFVPLSAPSAPSPNHAVQGSSLSLGASVATRAVGSTASDDSRSLASRPELSSSSFAGGSLGSVSPGGSTASCGSASRRELSPQTALAGYVVSMGTQPHHQLLPQHPLPQQLAQAPSAQSHPHGASSSVAATEGSPPSSPRSTFSSVHSFGQHEPVALPPPSGLHTLGGESAAGPARIAGCLGGGATPSLGSCCLGAAAGADASRAFCDAHGVLTSSPGVCGRGVGSGRSPAAGDIAALNGEGSAADYVSLLSSGAFEVAVQSPDMSFNCSHFVAYRGYRERLHGHNYAVAVRLGGAVGPDGYVLDFGEIKRNVREICKSLNEYLIVPMRSDVLDITQEGQSMIIRCEDGAEFKIPCSDCQCLPLVHSSTEEICCYLWQLVIDKVTLAVLKKRGVKWLEVTVSETPLQKASFRREIQPMWSMS